MKTIVCGSRGFSNFALLAASMDMLHALAPISEIVSGGARGADALGEQWAETNTVAVKRFPADWSRYGRSAGPRRNEEMAAYADACVAFWDGTSRGTAHMIKAATARHLRVTVVNYLQMVGALVVPAAACPVTPLAGMGRRSAGL